MSSLRALRDAGHDADIVVTPQNRFGRQASAYIATWLTDVRSTDGRPIDQVISLRYPSYAVRHPATCAGSTTRCAKYDDLWERFSSGLSPQARFKERVRRTVAARGRPLSADPQRLAAVRAVANDPGAPRDVAGAVVDRAVSARAATSYRRDVTASISSVSRLTPLKRADLLIRALAARGTASAPSSLGKGRSTPGSSASPRSSVCQSRDVAGSLDREPNSSITSRAAAPCSFRRSRRTTGSSRPRRSPRAKPVVTCRDGGRPGRARRSGVNGFVCDPTPDAVARALAA